LAKVGETVVAEAEVMCVLADPGAAAASQG